MNWFLIINDPRFNNEFKKYVKQHSKSILYKSSFSDLFQKHKNTTPVKELIAVNSSNQVHIIRINEIIHCQSEQSYTRFHLAGGKKVTATKTLKQFENLLSGHRFIRVHQSHLVNIKYVERYIKGNGGYIVMNDGTEIPVSSRKKEYLLKAFEKL